MRFRYSIARYMPSIVRGELLNLGVLIEDEEGRVAARFVSRFAHVRALYPDADLETLKLIRAYFTEKYKVPSEQLSLFTAHRGCTLDALIREHQGVLSLSDPQVTLGSSMQEELDDLFREFAAPNTSLAPKPISSVVVAPSQLRRRLMKWMGTHHLEGPQAYQADFTVPGAAYPWQFDYGAVNGKVTLVQSVALRTAIDTAMNRAALVWARVEDARRASNASELGDVVAIAVHDLKEDQSEATFYLNQHGINAVPIRDRSQMEKALEPPLAPHRELSYA